MFSRLKLISAEWLWLTKVGSPGIVFWLAVLLLFVFSLPHVIALRNALMVVLLALVSRCLFERRSALIGTDIRVVVLGYVALMIWMMCVIVFIAPDPSASFSAFVGEWVRASVALLIGVGVAFSIEQKSGKHLSGQVAMLLFLASMSHVFFHDMAALLQWAKSGVFPTHFSGISDQKANVTYVIAILLSVVGADICSRYAIGRSILPINLMGIAAVFVLVFFALVTARSTNGWIVSIALLTFVAIVAQRLTRGSERAIRYRMQARLIASAGVVFVLIGIWFVASDSRYEGFWESIQIGWDTENYPQWRDAELAEDFPRRKNGMTVDPSTYARVAWGKEGIKLLLMHPLGTEISKNTFQRLVNEEHGVGAMAHTHIGLVDFGLNVGFPGIVLWLWFLAGLAWIGWVTMRSSGDGIGLCMLFLIATFSMRMLVDSTIRDHILEQFMLCVGMLMVACTSSRQKTESAFGQ